MLSIHVRDVSDDTMRVLKIRAARAGQSFQAYVRALLDAEAGSVPAEEAAERARSIAARGSVHAEDVTAAIDAGRQARE